MHSTRDRVGPPLLKNYSTHKQWRLKIDAFILGLIFSKLWLDKIAKLFSNSSEITTA